MDKRKKLACNNGKYNNGKYGDKKTGGKEKRKLCDSHRRQKKISSGEKQRYKKTTGCMKIQLF